MMTPHLNFKFRVQTFTVLISSKVTLLLLSRKTQLKISCHRRRKRISGKYSVRLPKNCFQRQPRSKKKTLAEFLKSSTQLLKLKTV